MMWGIMTYCKNILAIVLSVTAITAAAQQPSSPLPAGVATATGRRFVARYGRWPDPIVVSCGPRQRSTDRQAVVKLYDETMKHPTWQPTSKNSDTTFDGLSVGKYDLEVSAIGYLTARKGISRLGQAPA